MRLLTPLLALTFTALISHAEDAPAPAAPSSSVQSLYDLKVTTLDGKPVDLAQYKGKVVLVVNVASKCGFTPEYAGLEKVYNDNKEKGLVVLGFPSNDFKQEPGTAQEIQTFCSGKNVTFPLFEKVSVKKGPEQSPVFQFLTSTGQPEPKWNFFKYLVDRNGKVIKAYPSPVLKFYPDQPEKVTPETHKFLEDLDTALKS